MSENLFDEFNFKANQEQSDIYIYIYSWVYLKLSIIQTKCVEVQELNLKK